MLTTIRLLGVSLCVLNLSSCMINDTGRSSDPSYGYGYGYENPPLYPEGYESIGTYSDQTVNQTNVSVPESYHVGAERSPTRPKDVDKSWVSSQNPQGYTIEVAEGEKAAQVAGVLQKAPKNERMAEVKSQQGGKTYYKGLYGSYDSQEAAQQALNALPDDLKQSAGVKTWGSVQNNLSE